LGLQKKSWQMSQSGTQALDPETITIIRQLPDR